MHGGLTQREYSQSECVAVKVEVITIHSLLQFGIFILDAMRLQCVKHAHYKSSCIVDSVAARLIASKSDISSITESWPSSHTMIPA